MTPSSKTLTRPRSMDLPDELLDDVLRRIPPRHLAACRRVCKNWRAVIDGRGLVLAHLAPRPLRGIFINFLRCARPPSFFSRGAPTSPSVGGRLRFLPHWWMMNCPRILDHSNGLLLYEAGEAMYVCNPVTRRWATVLPPPCIPFNCDHLYLVSDPTVSLNYHLLYFPDTPDEIDYVPPPLIAKARLTEWPPLSYKVQVFSSRTGQWEERNFIREGDAVGTMSDAWSDQCSWGSIRCHAVYLQGVFYLHCRGGFLIRLSLLQDKYLPIKTPRFNTSLRRPRSCIHVYDQDIRPCGHLRRSQHGVYYTIVHGYKLSVWVLCEASETRKLEWELKHQADLELSFLRHYNQYLRGDGIGKSWILIPSEEESNDNEWDSSDETVTDVGKGGINKECCMGNRYYGMHLLGYHPYKEIVFLSSHYNGFAYYLGTSKLESLGLLRSGAFLSSPYRAPTHESFIYTPCMDDLFPAHDHPWE